MSEDVVAWGDEAGEPDRSRMSALMDRPLISDPRAPLWTAGTGGALIAVSLMADWQTTVTAGGRQQVQAGVAQLGAWGAGYLLGALGLSALAALCLLGEGPARRHARLAGLGLAGGLLLMLVALAAALGADSLIILPNSNAPDFTVRVGAGVFLALLGVAAVGAGLYLSGAAPGRTAERGPGRRPVRRPVRRSAAPRPALGPSDLTVSPATPFLHLPDPPRQPGR